MPYYNRDPKRNPHFNNHPGFRWVWEHEVQGSGLEGVELWVSSHRVKSPCQRHISESMGSLHWPLAKVPRKDRRLQECKGLHGVPTIHSRGLRSLRLVLNARGAEC